MLADRIRSAGVASASLVMAFSLLGVAAVTAVAPEVTAPRVSVAASEQLDAPIREVQYVAPPVRQRSVICRYELWRHHGEESGAAR